MSVSKEIWKTIDQAIFFFGFFFLAIPAVFMPTVNLFNMGTLYILVGMYSISAFHEEQD